MIMESFILVLFVIAIFVLLSLLVSFLNIDNDKISNFSIRLAVVLLIIFGIVYILMQGFLIFGQNG